MTKSGAALFLAACAVASAAGALGDFAGTWRYEPAKSETVGLPSPPAQQLVIEVAAGKVTCLACGAGGWSFTGDGKPLRSGDATVRNSIETKWEGSALLINALVSGPSSYTVMDRWKLTRDGATLTIQRVVQRGANEAESKLVYSREGGADAQPPVLEEPAALQSGVTGVRPLGSAPARVTPGTAPPPPEPAKAEAASFEVARGTKMPLRVITGVSSRSAQEGERVYLETTFPVMDKGRIVIPPGSQVAASVTYAQQAGRVKGRSELMLRFESLVLPNGVTRDVRSRMSSVEPGSGELDSEGKVKGPGSKGEDARKVGETTATGAAVGSVVGAATGRYGTGAAIGAAAGAAAGLGRVLGGRGQETGFQRGDVVEMLLDRTLSFAENELPRVR